MVTVIRPLPCEVRKGKDTTPPARCPLTARHPARAWRTQRAVAHPKAQLPGGPGPS
jgi:hypothetical protein